MTNERAQEVVAKLTKERIRLTIAGAMSATALINRRFGSLEVRRILQEQEHAQ